MRLPSFFALVALLCAAFALAFDKDDFEIFDLVAALEASEGKGTSFYSFLGVEPSASNGEINKAYRRRSLELHPDKNRGVRDIEARFARLGVIAQILRNSEKRERYNFFYKNGVPKWKGLGYVYERWRPGLGFVVVFLTIVTAGLHYVVMRMNHARDTRRVAYFTAAARKAAAGAKGRRKVRVPMVEGSNGGGMLELVVDGDDVLLPHDDGTATPLDSLAPAPSMARTWPAQLTKGVWARLGAQKNADVAVEVDEEVDSDDVDGFDVDESGPDDTPTPPARGAGRKSRAAELRAQRLAGGKSATESETGTEGEEDATAALTTAAETKRKKPAGGKAAAARRRKANLKK